MAKKIKLSKASLISQKGWVTRRENAEKRSAAARKGNETRRQRRALAS